VGEKFKIAQKTIKIAIFLFFKKSQNSWLQFSGGTGLKPLLLKACWCLKAPTY